jgi:hypothetical protein
MFANVLVHAPVRVRARRRPTDHLAVFVGRDDERLTVLDPAADVLDRAWRRFERRDALGDASVLDLDHPGEVTGLGPPYRQLFARRGHGVVPSLATSSG